MTLLNKIKRTVEPAYKQVYKLCIKLFYYLPIKKNKIVFIQGVGGGYRCNLKYVAEEIVRQKLPYDLVWLVEKWDIEIPQPIRRMKYNRIRAVYELATAHIMINNEKSYYPVKKKCEQKFIYIPHGEPGCKCAEGDAVLTEAYIRASKFHSSQTDVFVSLGTYHTQVLKDTFWVPQNAEIWQIGFPRNDIYYKDSHEKVKDIRKKLNVPDGMRIAFYAPTFRDSGRTDAYDLDLHRVLQTLERKTGDKWMFFVTLHHNFVWFKHPVYDFGERIWDMTWYTDIHELLLLADIAISDYSSVALDFSNTRRPIFLYASDIDEYKRMRGLKDLYFKLPFPRAKNNDEMEANIMDFDKDKYAKSLEEFYKMYGSVDDGHASERFVEKLRILIDKRP